LITVEVKPIAKTCADFPPQGLYIRQETLDNIVLNTVLEFETWRLFNPNQYWKDKLECPPVEVKLLWDEQE